MDGMHDLGGKQGFGPIRMGANGYHEDWEPRANALYSLAVRNKIFNMDEYRHAIERMDARHYLSASYFERTFTACATLCVEKGVLTQAELEEIAGGPLPLSTVSLGPGRAPAVAAEPLAIGDRVVVKPEFVSGHVRMPGYIRGKRGVIVGESPPYPYPDSAAHGLPHVSEPTYDVRFATEELWPDSADRAFVHVGVFRSYLRKADPL